MPTTPTDSAGRHSDPGSASTTTNRNTPTRELSDSFDAAFDFFNQQLFADALPTCLITAQRKAKAGSYYAPGRFARRSDGSVTIGEIAVNPECWGTQSVRQTLSTVAREMVHHWQYTDPKAKPSQGYHNSEWSAKMVEIGLTPINPKTRKPAKAAQSMSHEIVEGGPFDLAAAEFEAAAAGEDRDPVPFMERWNEDDEKKAKARAKRDAAKSASKSKWVCPLCGDIYRAKTTAKPGCFKHEIPTACELEDAEAPEDDGDDDNTQPPPLPAPSPPKPSGTGSKAKASKAVAIIPAPQAKPKSEPKAKKRHGAPIPLYSVGSFVAHTSTDNARSIAVVVSNGNANGIELRSFLPLGGYDAEGMTLGKWSPVTRIERDPARLSALKGRPSKYPEPSDFSTLHKTPPWGSYVTIILEEPNKRVDTGYVVSTDDESIFYRQWKDREWAVEVSRAELAQIGRVITAAVKIPHPDDNVPIELVPPRIKRPMPDMDRMLEQMFGAPAGAGAGKSTSTETAPDIGSFVSIQSDAEKELAVVVSYSRDGQFARVRKLDRSSDTGWSEPDDIAILRVLRAVEKPENSQDVPKTDLAIALAPFDVAAIAAPDAEQVKEPPPIGSYVRVHFAGKSQLAHVIAHKIDGSIMVRAWNNKSGRGGHWMPNTRRIALRTVRSMAEKPEQLPDPPPLT